MSQYLSDDERLYFEVAKIRARRKSRSDVEQNRRSQPLQQHDLYEFPTVYSRERSPPILPTHYQRQQRHQHNSHQQLPQQPQQQQQPRQVDERLILNILQRIRAKRNTTNGTPTSVTPSHTSPQTSLPQKKERIITEKLYFTTEGTQTEVSDERKVRQHSTATSIAGDLEEENVIEGIVEDLDEDPQYHYSTSPPRRLHNTLDESTLANHRHPTESTATRHQHDHSRRVARAKSEAQMPRREAYSFPTTTQHTRRTTPPPVQHTQLTQSTQPHRRTSPSATLAPPKPRNGLLSVKKSSLPSPIRSHFHDTDMVTDEDVYFSSPQQSPVQIENKKQDLPFDLNNGSNISTQSRGSHDEYEDETKMVEVNDFRLTNDRIQQFRVAMSPSENRLLYPPAGFSQSSSSGSTPIFVDWPPSPPSIYKSAHSLTSLHRVPPPQQKNPNHPPPPPSTPVPPKSRYSPPAISPPTHRFPHPPTPDFQRKQHRFSGDYTPSTSHTNHRYSAPSSNRHSITFGTPTTFYSDIDNNNNTNTDLSNSFNSSNGNALDEVDFMEDDKDESAFMQSVQQYVHASSLYDLSPSLTKSRQKSQQHSQPNHASPQTHPQTQPQNQTTTKTPSQNTQPTESLQSTPSHKPTSPPPDVTGGVGSSSKLPGSVGDITPPPQSPDSAPPLREDILQVVSEGAAMLKVSRRSAPERRYFRVVVADPANALPQLVWSKSQDSKAVSSVNIRDVTNIFYGVPSAKLLQSSKKSPASDLAARVFSVVTRQRTLEILADSHDQRKVWVDALTHMQQNMSSTTKFLRTHTPSRSSTPNAGRKSPFRFLRSKTPDF